MTKSRRFLALTLAIALGGGFFGIYSYGATTTLVTMCFRNRTIFVSSYLVNTYRAQGAGFGACPTSQ